MNPDRSPMGQGTRVFRVAFGLFWVASGLSGLLGLVPPPSTAAAGRFLSGLAAAGYLMPLMCVVQVLAGTLIVSRRLAPVGLVVLAPVMLHVLAFRLFLGTPDRLPVALAPLGGHLFLAWAHRRQLAPLFRPRLSGPETAV